VDVADFMLVTLLDVGDRLSKLDTSFESLCLTKTVTDIEDQMC